MENINELISYLETFKDSGIILTDDLRNLIRQISRDLEALEALKKYLYINQNANLSFYDNKLNNKDFQVLHETLDFKPRNFKPPKVYIK